MRPLRESLSIKSLTMMGVPKHFCKKTLMDFDTYKDKGLKSVKTFVSDYLDNLVDNIEENRGIFFYGSNGVGKSMLSCIILKEAYRYRYSCRRVTFSTYVHYYTNSWDKKGNEREVYDSDFYESYKGVEFLVLEELGKEIDSKIAKPILEDLLRYREEHGLVTIMCSNIDPHTIEELYGASVMSLIKGSMTPICITSKDKRLEVYKNAK